jgi:hypothetical protein
MTSQISSGWICAQCGAFVPSNESHECPNPSGDPIPSIVPGFVYQFPAGNSQDEEIVELLREILEQLKKIEYNTR